jgi:hypothetical protein
MHSSDDRSALRLPLQFDPARLQADLAACAATAAEWVPQSRYGIARHENWIILPLRSRSGRIDDGSAGNQGLDPFRDTELMAHAPYVRTVLDQLGVDYHSIRLSRLPPGGKIKEHNDEDLHPGPLAKTLGLFVGRLHVPITTNADVEFLLDGVPQRWQPGECWYGDFSRLHSVANHGASDRVHLLIDCALDSRFERHLPPGHFLREILPPAGAGAAIDRELVGTVWAPPSSLLDLVDGALSQMDGPKELIDRLLAQFRGVYSSIQVDVDAGRPMLRTRAFHYRARVPAPNVLVCSEIDLRLEFKREREQWTAAAVTVKPRFLSAALFGDLDSELRVPLTRR